MPDRARDRKGLERGGGRHRAALDLAGLVADDPPPDDLIDPGEALGRLGPIDARSAGPVKLRIPAGLTPDDSAAAPGVVRRTAERDRAFVRTRLYRQPVPRDTP